MSGTGESSSPSRRHDQDLQNLKEKLEQEIKASKELEKLSKQIEITITPEGLRIELIEDKNGTFYRERQRAPERQRTGAAGAAGRGTEDAAQ